MQRHWRISRILLGLLLLVGFVWGVRAPRPAPAAANTTITPLFLGSLSGGATTNPGSADRLFTTLAGNATTSIDVAMYDFGRASVRDALVAAQGRGVDVRIVAESDAVEDPSDGPFYSNLMSAGIPVISDTLSSLQHNKFAIFDSAVTWTGSANWSDSDFARNGNNVLAITDTVVASIYATEFEEMFGGAFSNSKTDNTAHSALVGDSQVEVAFSPTDSIESRIVGALGTANATIQVAMFTFTNDAIGDALIAARGCSVQVEVLLDGLAACCLTRNLSPLTDKLSPH